MTKAVIMAGGQGTRLQPLTCTLPKPLVPVANRPVIDYILELLAQHHFDEVVLTLHYRAEEIIAHVGDGSRYGLRIRSVIETEPLGTAGSVKQAVGQSTEPVLVISGDCLTDFDLGKFGRGHQRSGAVVSLALTRVERPVEYGIVIADDEGRIERFLEKPSWGEVFSDTINTGIYLLEPAALAAIPDGVCDFSRNLFPQLLADGQQLSSQVLDGYWCDIGDLTQYREAQQAVLSGRVRVRLPGEQHLPGIWVGEECRLQGTVEAPVTLGRRVVVEAGAVVNAGCCLGDDVTVAVNSRISRSVLWKGSRVEADAQLLDAVVCDGSVVGEGSILCPGVVLGQTVHCGAFARIGTDVKVWPEQVMGDSWHLSRHLRSKVRSPLPLVYRGRVEGDFNRELLVEDACRIGRALAASGSVLIIGYAGQPQASAVAAALSAGARAAGCEVINLGEGMVPLTRFAVRALPAQSAVHVSGAQEHLSLLLFDEQGEELTGAGQRRFEGALDQEGTGASAVGHEISYDVAGAYVAWLLEHLPKKTLQQFSVGLRLPSNGGSSLGRWLRQQLGWEEQLTLPVLSADAQGQWQLRFGIEREVREEQINALAAFCFFAAGGKTLAAPVSLPGALHQLAQRMGGRLVRRKQNSSEETYQINLGNAQIRQSVFWQDELVRLLYCLSWLGTDWNNWAEVLSELPATVRVSRRLEVPQAQTGRIMRSLIAAYGEHQLDLVDGLHISASTGWVWGRPDGHLPIYHIEADAFSWEAADELAADVEARIKELLAGDSDRG